MNDGNEDAAALFDRARQEPPNSRAQVEALKLAARTADAALDHRLAYEARAMIVSAAVWSGAIRDALVAFAACLAQCDRDPERFPESALHWHYKWMIEWAPHFSEISRAQIERLLDDAQARFEKRGLGAKAIWGMRAKTSAYLGDTSEIAPQYEAWQRTARDALSDCALCDDHAAIERLIDMGRETDAIGAAEQLFRKGRMCMEIPHLTYATILLPLLSAGRGNAPAPVESLT